MALTPKEEAELAALEAEMANQEAIAIQNTPLTPEEENELALLEAQVTIPQSEIENVEPEGLKGRFEVKNFMDPKSAEAFNYLQKQNPEFILSKDASGEIVAKKRDDEKYGRLDPTGFDLGDIKDVAYDIPAGLAQGVATAAAGASGAAFGGGLGALPAAMATGAATGAGIEKLKNFIAEKVYGVENKPEYGVAALMGTLGPLVGGTGVTAKQAASLASKSLGALNADEILAKTFSGGLIEKPLSFVSKTTASSLSGIPKDAISAYVKNTPKVNQLIEEGAADYVVGVHNKVTGAVKGYRTSVGEKLQSKLAESDALINTSDIFDPIVKKSEGLRASSLGKTADARAEISALEKAYLNASVGLPEKVDARDLFTLQQKYKEMANFGADLRALTPEERSTVNAYRDIYKSINSKLDNAAETAGVKTEYQKASKLQDMADKYFKDPEKTYNTLSGLDAPSKEFVRKLTKDVSKLTNGVVDVKTDADILKAYNYFKDPGLVPLSTGGSTSTSRSELLGGFKQMLGSPMAVKQMSRATGAVSRAAPTKAVVDTARMLQYPAYLNMKPEENK